MFSGLSFGLITQRSQVQILTPLPIEARPDRVFPYSAFSFSLEFFSPQVPPASTKGPGCPPAPARWARRDLPSFSLAPSQGNTLVTSSDAVAQTVEPWDLQSRGRRFNSSRQSTKAAASREYVGEHRGNLLPADCREEAKRSHQKRAKTRRLPILPKNEQGPRANGAPVFSNETTTSARRDDYAP